MSDDLATPAPEADATKAVADADPKAKDEANTLKAEKSEPETVSEDADKPDTEDKDDQPRDKQGRFEKRKERLSSEIASLTAAKRSTERELAELSRRAEALRRDLSTKPQIDPSDFEAQDLHRVRTAVKAEKYQETIETAKQLQERVAAERYETFMKKVEAARDTDSDLDDALDAFWAMPVSDYAADIIAESDVAPQLAKYLAKHPREAKEIMAMSPHKQGLALARIEARITASPPVRKVSQAPAPVPTVGGSKPTAAKALAEQSVEELSNWYAKKFARR